MKVNLKCDVEFEYEHNRFSRNGDMGRNVTPIAYLTTLSKGVCFNYLVNYKRIEIEIKVKKQTYRESHRKQVCKASNISSSHRSRARGQNRGYIHLKNTLKSLSLT